jgi:DNA-directed RNA polymerase subunit RPC12/RpoP
MVARALDFNMNFKRILHTTPFQRLKLALIPLLVVDLILVPISLFGGSPSLWGIIFINFLVILILVLRFTFLFVWKLRCRVCGKGSAMDTGTDDQGYPVVRCRRCGRQWIL